MRRAVVVGLVVSALGIAGAVRAQQARNPAPAAPPDRERAVDEQAVRDAVAAFTRAFNAGDAPALARLHTADAQVELEDGTVVAGRASIEEQFARLFGGETRPRIALETDSIQFLGADAAIEEGRSAFSFPADDTANGNENPNGLDHPDAEQGRYTVLYVKRDGHWLHHRVRELPVERSPYDHLKELEWMVGDWVNEQSGTVVETSCAWSENRAYLLREFTLKLAGKPAMTGTQRIGWDPLTKQIRSWVFDSEGGRAEGLWSRDGDRWIVKLNGVLRDGRVASATQIITYLNRDSSTWTSVDRAVGGEVEPDVEVVVLVRQPPRPAPTVVPPTEKPAPSAPGAQK